MGSRFLVTGGAGFIGSNLTHALAAAGERVRVLDDFSSGKRENLAGLEQDVEIVSADLRDAAAVARACAGVEFVLHQGAIPSVPRSFLEPAKILEVNVLGTLNVIEGARRAGVRRIVYASSSSVYGDQKVEVKDEALPTRPMSPYAASKLAGEHLLGAAFRAHGFETVALRYFNVFGPRQDPHSAYSAVIPRFVTALLGGGTPEVYGDGGHSRDFTFIDNVIAGNRLACTAPAAAGEVMNLACGASVTLLDLLDRLGRIAGRKAEPKFLPPRVGDVRSSLAGIARATRILGYHPEVSLDEGLRRTVEWYASRVRKAGG
ncbi:MAG: NAD-dependent epimerase/dehydratase family protein [Planctomycetes bacterium]|nr:NAD-dependent epimerase/dehydratase family protein [Planctomycetota bacterium]MBI3845844.1 NAD-dependent epimerase/dehydratase family protein [Planctomycetota bacterium]